MAWVAVTKQGREFISICKPIRVTDKDNYYGWKDTFTEISLCSGSIKKLIGRELSWSDEPVELKEKQLWLNLTESSIRLADISTNVTTEVTLVRVERCI